MKNIISLLLLVFMLQPASAQKTNFFRVYNLQGKKVNKGVLFQMSDTSVTLTRRNIFMETPISQIDVIKSKRTTGHRILKTTLVVVGAAVFFVASVYSLSRNNGPGYINSGNNRSRGGNKGSRNGDKNGIEKPPRPQKKYKVNGDTRMWQEQKKVLQYQLL